MAVSRYTRTPVISFSNQYASSMSIQIVRRAVKSGLIQTKEYIMHDNERLDTLAGALWGDGRYWWVLAATSDIGWGMQVPPGTVVNIPVLSDVLKIVG